jgi:hypothetical protein
VIGVFNNDAKTYHAFIVNPHGPKKQVGLEVVTVTNTFNQVMKDQDMETEFIDWTL